MAEERSADNSREAVGFIFGALDAHAVPGPVLVQLMEVLGIGEPATRQLLARMQRQQDLVAEREGRVSVYRLAGDYLDRWIRLRHGDPEVPWRGGFEMIVHDLPESLRRQREALQAVANRHGWGQLRPGVLIGITPATFVDELFVRPLSGTGVVETGWWAVDLPVARRIARTAWALEARANDLRHARDRLDSILAGAERIGSGDGRAAFRLLWKALAIAGSARYAVPTLPAEVLSDHWPAASVQERLSAVIARLQTPTEHYLYEFLSVNSSAHLVHGGWWPRLRDPSPEHDVTDPR